MIVLTLSDIVDVIMLESGQFIAGDTLECLGISTDKFWNGIVKNRLKFYQRYRPQTKSFNRTAEFTTSYGSHVFFGTEPDEKIAFDNRVSENNTDTGEVPKWISSVIPISTSGKLTLDLIRSARLTGIGEQDTIINPRKFYWNYERDSDYGILYLTENGSMDIRAHYEYNYEVTRDSDDKITEVEISNIDEAKDRIFIDLIMAKFLMLLGRSRRAFRLEGFPVEFDASDLLSEGRELEEQTIQTLYEQSNWYDAMKN